MKTLWLALLITTSATRVGWGAPVIQAQPKDQNVVFAQRAVFYMGASGAGELSYQWRKDGAAIVGATNDHFVIETPTFFDQGKYSVMVGDSEGSVTSNEAELRVRSPQAGEIDYRVLSDSWIDGNVAAMAVQGNGEVVIGGDFLTVSGANRTRLARLEEDGTTDFRFLDGMAGVGDRVWDSVSAVALQSGGKILVGGTFFLVNGTSKSGLVRLNENGSIDESFQSTGIEGYVYAIRVQNDGKILISGLFTRVNGVVRQSIARLNADGSLDGSFQSPVRESASVDTFAVQADGKVLIPDGGTVVRLNTNGGIDETFVAPEIIFVRSMEMDESGNVLVGGHRPGTGEDRGLVRLSSSGTQDTSFNPTFNGDLPVIIPIGGKILIGGSFTKVNGEDHRGVARLNLDGTTDNTFGTQLSGEWAAVDAMEVSEGKLYIGGSFEKVNGIDRINVARLNLDGTLDESFNNNKRPPILKHQISAMGEQADGKVILAGVDNQDDSFYNLFTRLNPDLSRDSTFGSEPLYHTEALAIHSTGKIVAGGYGWTMFRVNADGSEDTNFTKLGLNIPRWDLSAKSPFRWPEIFSIAVQPDDKFIAGGYFYAAPSNYIARFHVDGALDNSFKAGTDREVRSLAIQRDGKVVLGGMFTKVNGVMRSAIARVEPTGDLDDAFLNGLTGAQGGTVETVVLQADGKILIGGNFTNVNGVARGGLARLNEDGTLDLSFQDVGPAEVSRIAVDGERRVLVTGTIKGEPNVLIRLSSNGVVDAKFKKVVTAPTGITAMEVLRDDSLLIGGSFTSINGQAALYIARVWGGPPLLTAIRRDGAEVEVCWGTQANETYQLQYRNSLAGSEWTNVPGGVTGTGQIVTKTDDVGTGLRFYRVAQEP